MKKNEGYTNLDVLSSKALKKLHTFHLEKAQTAPTEAPRAPNTRTEQNKARKSRVLGFVFTRTLVFKLLSPQGKII